jgi:signal transduction histidine kinase
MSGTPVLAETLLEHLPYPVYLRPRGAGADAWRPLNAAARRLGVLGLPLCGDGAPSSGFWRLEAGEEELLVPGLDPESARRGEQLESFGRYTGGIVHNLNNPLNALSGMIQLMQFRHPELADLERLDLQTDELAGQIRLLGDRYRRLQEYERGTPLTWELVVHEELRFYRADAALKHRCEQELDLPADQPCPLPYREASWLFDRLLESILLLVREDDMSPLRVDLAGGWPCLRLQRPDLGRAAEARTLLARPLMLDLLAGCGRRLDWRADEAEAVAATAPLDN